MNATLPFTYYICAQGHKISAVEGYAHISQSREHPDCPLVDEITVVSLDANLRKAYAEKRGDVTLTRDDGLFHQLRDWLITRHTSDMQEALNDARMVA